MSQIVSETWDDGRLVVNRDHAELFRHHGLTTFDRVWTHTAKGDVAKNLRADRVTLRFTLDDPADKTGQRQPLAFFIKRHGRPPLKEYLKSLAQFRWPIVGAKHEWQALLQFHEVELPTMIPVALGVSGANSFLITAALDDCTKLSEWSPPGDRRLSRNRLIESVARLAKRMHGAGLHHQDFYLGHLLLSNKATSTDDLFIIDLGRVGREQPLASRWVVKDLAQLNYSARELTLRDRIRFARAYFGRKLTAADKHFLHCVASKTTAIARHSEKNGL